MIYDMHVHFAELHRHAATDQFLAGAPSVYMRMFLRKLGLDRKVLQDPHANEILRKKLFAWVSQCTVERFVVLAMDGVCAADGTPDPSTTSWVAGNDFIADVAAAHPALLFGASIHPYRKDALRLLERAIAGGACLVKWIPSTQRIRLDDPLCLPFFDMLAAMNIPLLVHTGPEHVSSRGRNQWNDPGLLIHPLKRGVCVIAAHCGARMFLHERGGFDRFCRLALEHERLYGDVSAFGIPTRIGPLRKLQKDPRLLAKAVYGSDFPAVVMPRAFVFSIGLKAIREILRVSNPLEQPYQLMRRMELPDEVFTRVGSVLRIVQKNRSAA